MLRGGLAGFGNVARNGHLPVWLGRRDVVIAGAADVDPGSRGAIAEEFPEIAWHDSTEGLLAEERLDFLDVCTPPATHAGLIRLALDRGVHVLCEKPLVLETSELTDLADLARGRNRALVSVHNWRYAPVLALASELVRAGRIGTVRHAAWEVLRERPSVAVPGPGASNWRLDPSISGGGILVDHGWHAVYVLAGWMPAALSAVRGRLETRRHREWPVEDTADVHLEFGDATARVFLTWAASERKNRVSIEGTDGAIRVEGRLLEVESRGRTERRELPGSLSEGSHHPDWFAGTAAEFLEEIADPARRGRSLAEAATCLEVIRLARASDRLGGATLRAGAAATASPAAEPAAARGVGGVPA